MTSRKASAIEAASQRGDLVDHRLEKEVRRAKSLYGPKAVREFVKQHTQPNSGRKPENDWPELWPIMEADARCILEDCYPTKRTTNKSIAKDFAGKFPGQDTISTVRRIQRKLSSHRTLATLLKAEELSREGYPFETYIDVLDALQNQSSHFVWILKRDEVRKSIERFQNKYGQSPPDFLSIAEIEFANEQTFGPLAGSSSATEPGQFLAWLKHQNSRNGKM